jgi:hypothetical protein
MLGDDEWQWISITGRGEYGEDNGNGMFWTMGNDE